MKIRYIILLAIILATIGGTGYAGVVYGTQQMERQAIAHSAGGINPLTMAFYWHDIREAMGKIPTLSK